MGYHVPQSLKECNNWVVWKIESKYNGNFTKIPYRADGHRARSNVPSDWMDYDTSIAIYQYSGEYDGIGFVLSKDDDFVFIDLDKSLDENGDPNDFAKQILMMFPNSYAEISQSERGLHIVCKGKISKALKTKEIEIYTSERYIALTGNAYNTNEPHESQKAIDYLYAKYGKEEIIKKGCDYKPEFQNDDIKKIIRLIQKSKQKEKFEMLNKGNWEGKYKSQSEADLAMVNILNYFCNGNEDTIKKIFLNSALGQRQKAYRKDYLQNMIDKAKISQSIRKSGRSRKRRF